MDRDCSTPALTFCNWLRVNLEKKESIIPSRDRALVRATSYLVLLRQGHYRPEDMAQKAGDGVTHGKPSTRLDVRSNSLYVHCAVYGRILLSSAYSSGEYVLLFSPLQFYTIFVTQPSKLLVYYIRRERLYWPYG